MTYWVVLVVVFRFWWGMMYEPSGAGWRVGVAREKLSSMRWIEVRNALDAFSPREMAWCRYPVGMLLVWSAIVGIGRWRSH